MMFEKKIVWIKTLFQRKDHKGVSYEKIFQIFWRLDFCGWDRDRYQDCSVSDFQTSRCLFIWGISIPAAQFLVSYVPWLLLISLSCLEMRFSTVGHVLSCYLKVLEKATKLYPTVKVNCMDIPVSRIMLL